MPDEPPDDAAIEETSGQEGSHRPNSDDDKIGFTLPPITLPPLRIPSIGLPADFSPIPPLFERVRGSGSLVLAALTIDVLDIIVLFVVGGGFARVAVGMLLVMWLVYPLGVLYAWEFLGVGGGIPWLGGVPSATLLVLADQYRSGSA